MNVDKSSGRIRRMFGEIAERYDFMNHLLSGGTDVYWRWRTVRRVAPDQSGPILDVCTGTGDLAFAYRKRAHESVRVIGTDFTHEMLCNALLKRDHKRIAKSDSIQFLEADTMHLPFADSQFQIVSVAFGLRNVADTRLGLSEMTRVCQPGGTVAILEFSLPTNRVIRALYGFYFRHILPRIGQLFARNKQAAYNYLPDSVGEFPQGEQLGQMMTQSGLETVHWTPFTFGVATLYCGRKPDPGGTTQPQQAKAAGSSSGEESAAKEPYSNV